jgi:hypothetical protein
MPSVNDPEMLLVEQFVASFEKLDDRVVVGVDPVEHQLSVGEPNEYGWKRWQPLKMKSESALLEPIYAKLPARFPRLYQTLVLSYRWAEVDLQSYRLLANPPGPDLNGLFAEMMRDPTLWKFLPPAGYIQFGRGLGGNYDPVCFDINSRKRNGDCRIVRIDHEEILGNDRVKVVAELAPSFEQLVMQTIDHASQG